MRWESYLSQRVISGATGSFLSTSSSRIRTRSSGSGSRGILRVPRGFGLLISHEGS